MGWDWLRRRTTLAVLGGVVVVGVVGGVVLWPDKPEPTTERRTKLVIGAHGGTSFRLAVPAGSGEPRIVSVVVGDPRNRAGVPGPPDLPVPPDLRLRLTPHVEAIRAALRVGESVDEVRAALVGLGYGAAKVTVDDADRTVFGVATEGGCVSGTVDGTQVRVWSANPAATCVPTS
ncbi:hypothetical protein [Actinokineospora enzanensis]|uniref:hypothetical protein n=1 Tax=Actinokineospora enzanensis TaxID=155975 RepID=UPI0012EBB4A7|nr:hypothetical protein [Actinokineospora enzanensis]